MRRVTRRVLALAAAIAVFCLVWLAAAAVLPSVLGLLVGCFPPTGGCGDSAGWAMIISAPVSLPLILIAAIAGAVLTYGRIAGK